MFNIKIIHHMICCLKPPLLLSVLQDQYCRILMRLCTVYLQQTGHLSLKIPTGSQKTNKSVEKKKNNNSSISPTTSFSSLNLTLILSGGGETRSEQRGKTRIWRNERCDGRVSCYRYAHVTSFAPFLFRLAGIWGNRDHRERSLGTKKGGDTHSSTNTQ